MLTCYYGPIYLEPEPVPGVFYKDDVVLNADPVPNLVIPMVTAYDEGSYKCENPKTYTVSLSIPLKITGTFRGSALTSDHYHYMLIVMCIAITGGMFVHIWLYMRTRYRSRTYTATVIKIKSV